MKTFERRGERRECGNRVEQARDAQRVIHPARGTHQAQAAAFARESGALTHQRADAGAIHLEEAAQIHEQLLAAGAGDALQFAVENFAVFAERGAAARRNDHDVAIGARVDFEFWMFDVHNDDSTIILLTKDPAGQRAIPSQKHYTTEKPLRQSRMLGMILRESFYETRGSVPNVRRNDSQKIRRAN